MFESVLLLLLRQQTMLRLLPMIPPASTTKRRRAIQRLGKGPVGIHILQFTDRHLHISDR